MTAAPLRSQVLRAYKDLLRAERKTFEFDSVQITQAREHTRQQFLAQANETDAAKIAQLVKVANQAATIIRKNIVQGVKDTGRTDGDVYKLRLDSEKEINDNDTIRTATLRQPAQRTGKEPVRCCSA
ncbi:hypothetical protein HDU87_002165 [Geranomyces variabilis]|uniref:Mitochondrial zinc maintenance protein 1, mitochondrial n=1 Tax=Geranomyces variabilis TaxID=109894 RepID=A0AAD5TM75_9FUNG|nr:hypothetical protein HDU87_002165 [Geranomyces variabilis]